MSLFDLFWSMLWFFMFVIWIWLLITIFVDIFRSHDMGGWAKAGWVFFIIILPFLGVLIYVIARGNSMHERQMKQAADQDAAARQYIQEAAQPASSADEVAKLAQLHKDGVLTDDEYAAQKAKALGS
ncbi:MAG: SHOCT domain-containing protein [Acidimicrobiia bacterium]